MSSIEIKIPIADLQKRKLFLATPMYGGQCAGLFTKSIADLTALCVKYGVQLQFYFLFNESLITRARNYCCDEFVRSDSSHLLFIDSDIGFNPQDVLAMLAMMGEETEYDVMAAPYPKKCISWEKIKTAVEKGKGNSDPNDLEKYVGDFVFNPKVGSSQIPIGQPVEVLEAGTGFMMIRRKTFERFQEFYPELTYRPDHVRAAHFDGSRAIFMYFQAAIDDGRSEAGIRKAVSELENFYTNMANTGMENITTSELALIVDGLKKSLAKADASRRYLSEDYWFNQRIQEAGLKVWFCPWMKTQHVGTYVFGGSLPDLAELGVTPTADPTQLKAIRDKVQTRSGLPAPLRKLPDPKKIEKVLATPSVG